jgi:two-component system sensor histidine kinase YesM
MYEKTKTFLASSKIKYKILLCMIIISTLSLLFISTLSYTYFSNMYERDAIAKSTYTLDVVSGSLRSELTSIFIDTTLFVSSHAMSTTLIDLSMNNSRRYLYNYAQLQRGLDSIVSSKPFVDAAYIIGKNGEFFSLSDLGLKHDTSTYFDMDLSKVDSITFLPVCKSPFAPRKDVIPIVMPIIQIGGLNTPFIQGTVEDATATLFLLLDYGKLLNYFQVLNKNSDSTLYLANREGMPLSLLETSSLYATATHEEIVLALKENEPSIQLEKALDNDRFLIAALDLDLSNLKLVSIISKNHLLSGLSSIENFILAAWFLSFALTVIFSLMLSRFITKPFATLMTIVKKIENGHYFSKFEPKYKDEIGKLTHSINSMYDTISMQMEKIKKEEEEKFTLEMAMLSEQINPHFLYNTLECIHLEILSGNLEPSARMIESLGKFLRIGLNHGVQLIPIYTEIQHAQEYMNILNYRSNDKIAFTYTLDDTLKDQLIPKLILQPLIENSIKHGFSNQISNYMVLSPAIHIDISIQDEVICFIISDNGQGIDIEKAQKALYNTKNAKKMGLYNVYKRLCTYYNLDIAFDFLTTPYFKNSVIIKIPSRKT